ncbi:MAG: ROK family protein [Patescibacteria group bacterium]|nr:ROK family protein [Patescibacteria group bacterium]
MKFGAAKNYDCVLLAIVFGTGIGGAIASYEGRNNWAGEFGKMVIDRNKTWEQLYQATKNNSGEQEKINAIGLANLINIFNPEAIVLGGGGARPFSKRGTGFLANHLLLKKQMPKIFLSHLGENAVALGAAALWQ